MIAEILDLLLGSPEGTLDDDGMMQSGSFKQVGFPHPAFESMSRSLDSISVDVDSDSGVSICTVPGLEELNCAILLASSVSN